MSLINKALARAEDERRLHNSKAPAMDMLGQTSRPNSSGGEEPPSGNRTRLWAAGALIMLVAGAAWAVMYAVKPAASPTPTPAQAGTTPTPEAAEIIPDQPVQWRPVEASPTAAVVPPPNPLPSPTRVQTQPPASPRRRNPSSPGAAGGLDARKFTLGAVLKSGYEARALINNQMLTVGQQIDGATVVAIEQHHVVLEKGGRRLVLRM